MLRLMLIALVAYVASGCGGTPEAGQNGTCSLECSSPVTAPANLIIERLDPDIENTLVCSAQGTQSALGRPVQVRYRAYTTGSAPEGEVPAEEGEEPAAELNLQAAAGAIRPAAGLGFEPWIIGAVDPESTNEEWKAKDAAGATIADPGKFLGVETSSSEMCSDSCGVMTYEFRPLCISGVSHDIQAGILAGFVKVKDFVKYTIDGTGGED